MCGPVLVSCEFGPGNSCRLSLGAITAGQIYAPASGRVTLRLEIAAPGLKPNLFSVTYGTAKAVPLQNSEVISGTCGTANNVSFKTTNFLQAVKAGAVTAVPLTRDHPAQGTQSSGQSTGSRTDGAR